MQFWRRSPGRRQARGGFPVLLQAEENKPCTNSRGFSTRVVLSEEFTDAAIDTAVSSATGLTAAQCSAVFRAYFDQFTLCAAGCGWSHNFHGVLSLRPSSGGSSPAPDGFNNAAELNANISFALNPVRRDAWQASLNIESQGQVGLLTPEIDSVINLANGT